MPTETQDFSQKFVIVINRELPAWQAMNAVAHIAAYLGNKMTVPFDTGSSFVSKDSISHPRNSQFPIIILSAKPNQMAALAQQARQSGLLHIGFIRDMIETTNDAEIDSLVSQKEEGELEYLGIGLFGPNDKVNPLTKKFSLWK